MTVITELDDEGNATDAVDTVFVPAAESTEKVDEAVEEIVEEVKEEVTE
jgi:hypothetical protein